MEYIGNQYVIHNGQQIEARIWSDDYASGYANIDGKHVAVQFYRNVRPGLFPVPSGESIDFRSVWRKGRTQV